MESENLVLKYLTKVDYPVTFEELSAALPEVQNITETTERLVKEGNVATSAFPVQRKPSEEEGGGQASAAQITVYWDPRRFESVTVTPPPTTTSCPAEPSSSASTDGKTETAESAAAAAAANEDEQKKQQEQLGALNADIKELTAVHSALDGKLRQHMNLLHDYNDLRDAAQAVIGQLALMEQCTTKDLYERFGLELDD
eukprot:TRINITY_DN14905_c0_g1_i1.p1 TRINITY_DN14905_c0_g1~~TRINITY_DN14905_c0_g1_i1.p1  ORF type:complete len:199 (-),score=56.05 TRINITY_DN14905_c0_g1_i1:217-813(-)